MTLALLAAEIAGGEEAAEPSVGGAVGRPDGHVRRSVAEGEAAADRVGRAGLSRRQMAANDSGERVHVGDGEAGEAQPGGRRRKLFRVRGAAQEGKIRGRQQLGIGGLAGRLEVRPLDGAVRERRRGRPVRGRLFGHVPVMFQRVRRGVKGRPALAHANTDVATEARCARQPCVGVRGSLARDRRRAPARTPPHDRDRAASAQRLPLR